MVGNVKGTSCDTRLSTPASDPASALIFFSEAILMLGPSILQRKKVITSCVLITMYWSLACYKVCSVPTESPGFVRPKTPPENTLLFFWAPQPVSLGLPSQSPSAHLCHLISTTHSLPCHEKLTAAASQGSLARTPTRHSGWAHFHQCERLYYYNYAFANYYYNFVLTCPPVFTCRVWELCIPRLIRAGRTFSSWGVKDISWGLIKRSEVRSGAGLKFVHPRQSEPCDTLKTLVLCTHSM